MAYYHPPRPSAPTTPLVTYRPNATYKISLGSPQGQRRINFTHKNKLHESLLESRALPTSCNQNYDSYNNSNRKRKIKRWKFYRRGKGSGKKYAPSFSQACLAKELRSEKINYFPQRQISSISTQAFVTKAGLNTRHGRFVGDSPKGKREASWNEA